MNHLSAFITLPTSRAPEFPGTLHSCTQESASPPCALSQHEWPEPEGRRLPRFLVPGVHTSTSTVTITITTTTTTTQYESLQVCKSSQRSCCTARCTSSRSCASCWNAICATDPAAVAVRSFLRGGAGARDLRQSGLTGEDRMLDKPQASFKSMPQQASNQCLAERVPTSSLCAARRDTNCNSEGHARILIIANLRYLKAAARGTVTAACRTRQRGSARLGLRLKLLDLLLQCRCRSAKM
jgi:hypothetical protein